MRGIKRSTMTTDTTTTTVSEILQEFSSTNRSEFNWVSAKGCKHASYRADQLLLHRFGTQHRGGLDRSSTTSYPVCCRPAHVWRPRIFEQLRARAATPARGKDSTIEACASAFGTQSLAEHKTLKTPKKKIDRKRAKNDKEKNC